MRSGLSGRRWTRTPKGARASSMAAAAAWSAGMVPPSHAPFTPAGFRGDGVSRWAISTGGTSAAVGSR